MEPQLNATATFPIPRGGLIVSCQARDDNPLHGPGTMAAMARATAQGGSAGIRANGVEDVCAIRAAVTLPLIGLLKRHHKKFPVYITPDIADAIAIAEAGADLIALDATSRARDGLAIAELIPAVKQRTGKGVFADVATLEEGVAAARLGAACVATTLSGYTAETANRCGDGPDLELVAALAGAVKCPVIAEGRFETPAQVREAFRRGAYAVVVGTAITNPREITRRFVRGVMGADAHVR
jgi:N-acylglucosamine-6-phosphate 2-epimerase/N-acetylmuramic acid 6-phosphate etherase